MGNAQRPSRRGKSTLAAAAASSLGGVHASGSGWLTQRSLLAILSRTAFTSEVEEKNLGPWLRGNRKAVGLTLRAVQDRTGGRVKNGYLSQIESGDIKSPSPTVLHELAAVYGLDYGEVLRKAGHPVPDPAAPATYGAIAGLPAAALTDLNEDEKSQLLEFVAFLKSRRVEA